MEEILRGLTDGVPDGKLYFEEYNSAWAEAGKKIVARLRELIPQAVEIRHSGSTAVVGMLSKPLIDIIVGLRDYAQAEDLGRILSAEGIKDFGEVIPGDRMYYLDDPSTGNRVLHIHVVQWNTENWTRYTDVTDYLNSHEDAKQAYVYLKKALLLRYADRPGMYNPAKARFLMDLREDARAWREGREK